MFALILMTTLALSSTGHVKAALSNLGSIPISNSDSSNIDENVLLVVFDDTCDGTTLSLADRYESFLSTYACFTESGTLGLFSFENEAQDTHHYSFINVGDKSCINSADNDASLPDLGSLCIVELLYDEMIESASFTPDRYYDLRDVSEEGLADYDGYAWHLDAVDGVLDNMYCELSGDGVLDTEEIVDIYILDNKINITHEEFTQYYDFETTQVVELYTCYPDEVIVINPFNYNSISAHGSWTASITAGYNYGVAARGQRIYEVQVLNQGGFGCVSCVIGGLFAVRDEMVSRGKRGVINQSIGFISFFVSETFQNLWNFAVNYVTDSGGIVVSAAGNGLSDDCLWPSATDKSIAVGAYTIEFERWIISYYGDCIDVYAPGESVTGAGNRANNHYITMSGTSAAAPVVSGIVANWLIECELLGYDEPCTYENVRARLRDNSVQISESVSSSNSWCDDNTCHGIKYECGDGFYPLPLSKCSESDDPSDFVTIGDSYSYCSETGAQSCAVYNAPSGCSQCESNTFKLSFDYPCVSCADMFGSGCMVCNDGAGCTQCESNSFVRVLDDDSGMYYCQPTQCLNDEYHCMVCNQGSGGSQCSQCDSGYNLVNNEYCV